MRLTRSGLCVLAGAFAAAVGCGGGEPVGGGAGTGALDPEKRAPETMKAETGKEAAPREKPGETLATGDSDYGTIVTDGKGLTLYLFTKESGDESECYGACAEAWPPFLTKGEPQAGKGVSRKLLGTTERRDGETQVTYDGHPLYYYVDEDEPGEVLCQGVAEFGGTWLVVSPSGDPVS